MSKLLSTLQSFSIREMKDFSLFMHSPYFNQHADTLALFDFLAPLYPDFPPQVYEKFCLEYPGELSRPRFHVLCTYLLKGVHRFMVAEEVQKRPILHKRLLAKRLRDQESYREAQKQSDQLRTLLNQSFYMDSDNFLEHLQLKEGELDLAFSTEIEQAPQLLKDFLVELDRHYLLFNCKYLLPNWSFSRMFGTPFPQERWRQIQQKINENNSHLPALVLMYFHLLHIVKGEEELIHLQRLLNLLDEHARQLSKTELINVYGHLQNYFTRHVHIGTEGALEQQFQCYQQMDDHDLVFGRGELSERLLRNITISGCRQGKQAWVAEFLQKNGSTISSTIGANAFAFYLAYLDFSLGAYSPALQKLQGLELKEPLYRTGHQVLLLRIYYELEHFESLFYLLDSFRRFLNRNRKFSEKQKDLNRNFLSILRQLARAREKGPNPQKTEKIREMLSRYPEVTDRTWLQEKLRELEEREGI